MAWPEARPFGFRSDGLSVEFFIKFWDTLGTDLVDVLNSSYLDGFLPSSSCKGLITLIFKKGDRLDRKNWRPITLPNVDYKLCARTLAARLLQVILSLDQEKAFDRVDWSFLFATLDKMGFGPSFIRWVRLL